MPTHEVTIDLAYDESTGDHAYRAFCETCEWADPDGWHHSETDDEDTIIRASCNATVVGLLHQAEFRIADDVPDVARFLATPIPAADATGYAHPDAAL